MRTPLAALAVLLSSSLVSPPVPVLAQTPGHGPAVLELTASARALALGGALQPDAGDSDAVFFNPAWASRGRGFALGWHRLDRGGRAVTASAAGEWFGGGVAVGLQALEYGTDLGPGERPGGLEPLLADGSVAVSDLVATVAWGRDLAGFRVGAAAKLVDQRHGGARRQDVAFDVGIARRLGPGQVGLALRNLGAEDATLGGVEVELPTDVTLGWGAYGRPLGPLDVGAAAAVTRRADGEWLAGGGFEFGYWPIQGRTFVGRLGVRTVPEGEASPFTFGGSFWGDDLVLDYAFQPVEGFDGVHRVTLGWR